MNKSSCYKKDGRVYIQKKKVPRKAKVMRRLGVEKNTFAGNMVSRVYDYYFDGALNFRREYKKYYKKEYSSVEEFIEDHFNYEHERAIMLARGNYSIKECSSQSIERNIETLNYDENFKEAFSKAVGGLEDEDSDGIYYK